MVNNVYIIIIILRILAYATLKKFGLKHSDVKFAIDMWYKECKKTTRKTPNDIKAKYPSASIIGNQRIIFNLLGNKYRLIVEIRYDLQIVFIKFIGTHAEYDKIDASIVNQF